MNFFLSKPTLKLGPVWPLPQTLQMLNKVTFLICTLKRTSIFIYYSTLNKNKCTLTLFIIFLIIFPPSNILFLFVIFRFIGIFGLVIIP